MTERLGDTPAKLHFPFPVTWQGRTFQRGETEVFVPRALDPAEDRGDHSLLAVGRLARGVSIGDAEERLDAARRASRIDPAEPLRAE